MSAAEALRVAHEAGVHVALDGLDLVLEAPAEPPPDLLKLLTERKADIVKLLRRQDDDAPDASPPLATAFAALERRCPDYVEPADWQQAVADGRRFLANWGNQAEALGWSERDLFGLHEPPAHPHPSYRRLSRHDATGLVWFLHSRPVIALTADSAVIATPNSGKLTLYRRAAS